ncbi:MAG: hypothetical protein ACOX64_08805 [Candidatus Merdivicinus sp.]|jgi:hypothetical protein
MNSPAAESAICALENALDRGEPVGAYLACANVLAELLALCYTASGMPVPPLQERFARLPETSLGREFLPNLEAYARLCIRLDGVSPGRKADTFSQVTDARRLLRRMLEG